MAPNYTVSSIYASEPKGQYREETSSVGQFPPSAFGLYDMHGNVWEWCADNWHENYEGAPEDGSAWIDKNDNNNQTYILRGGSWFNNPYDCRSAYRSYDWRGNLFNVIGFRIVCGGDKIV